MPVFKAINKKYSAEKDMKGLVYYVVREDRCIEGIYGAQGAILGTACEMYGQMEEIRKYYHKNTKRCALHYVLSFSKEEEKFIGVKEALAIGYQLAEYFLGWQVVFGVHTNTDNLHIHFAVNCISYENGRSISVGIQDLQTIQQAAQNIVECYYEATLPKEEAFVRMMNRLQGIYEPMVLN